MPELPEVEAVVRKLRPAAIGAEIVGVRVFRDRATHPQQPSELQRAAGHQIRGVERRGKNILLALDQGLSLRVHLRMTGNLTVIPDARLHVATVRVLLCLHDGRGLVLDDTRLLGSVTLHSHEELDRMLSKLGVDPLSKSFTPEYLITHARSSVRPAKLFLMDQYPIAGLGNIYAAESLFEARMNPRRAMNSFRRPRLEALHAAIRAVLGRAIPEAVQSYRDPGHHDGMSLRVYDREGQECVVCGTAIGRFEQGGRSTYWCRNCQR